VPAAERDADGSACPWWLVGGLHSAVAFACVRRPGQILLSPLPQVAGAITYALVREQLLFFVLETKGPGESLDRVAMGELDRGVLIGEEVPVLLRLFA